MSEGIGDELIGIDLGDERLNKRSKHLLEALADDPEASINAACDGWGDTVAAYRFFNNDAVTPEEILRPHREATIRRMREHPVVLLVQDTSDSTSPSTRPRMRGASTRPSVSGCMRIRIWQSRPANWLWAWWASTFSTGHRRRLANPTNGVPARRD